jgi:multisubunit Na+/H+ antiporter MnhB subunit
MYILGGFVVGCAAGVVILLVFRPVPLENKDIVNIALGTLLGMAVTVVGYFYGSSKSSSDKNEMLRPPETKQE